MGVFFQAVLLPSGLSEGRVVVVLPFWGDAGRFLYLGYVMLLSPPGLNLSGHRLSLVEKCWLMGFPVLSAALFTNEGKEKKKASSAWV